MRNKKANNPYYTAQAFLAHRDHAVHELAVKLKRKKFSKKQIDDAISRLKKTELLDDRKFTQTYIESTLSAKLVGPKWLTYKLKQKGVAQTIIDRAVSQAYQPGAEKELADQATVKWRQAHPHYKDDKQRLMRFLQSRGFSYHTIRSCLGLDA